MLCDAFPRLLEEAQQGVESAFEALWRDVNPSLVNYLRVIVGSGGEDVAAETWIHVVRGLPRFRGDEASWRNWLFTIARRRAVDHIRHQARRPIVHLPPAVITESSVEVSADSAEEAIANLQTHQVLGLVSALPPAQADVVMLRVVVGLSTEDVARIVKRSPGAVRVALHRGLKALADAIPEDEVTESARATIRTTT